MFGTMFGTTPPSRMICTRVYVRCQNCSARVFTRDFSTRAILARYGSINGSAATAIHYVYLYMRTSWSRACIVPNDISYLPTDQGSGGRSHCYSRRLELNFLVLDEVTGLNQLSTSFAGQGLLWRLNVK